MFGFGGCTRGGRSALGWFESLIVITDATPAFTLYQSAACDALPGNVTGCSVTTQPAVNGTGSVVWTLTGTLLSGGSGSVTYQVRLSP